MQAVGSYQRHLQLQEVEVSIRTTFNRPTTIYCVTPHQDHGANIQKDGFEPTVRADRGDVREAHSQFKELLRLLRNQKIVWGHYYHRLPANF